MASYLSIWNGFKISFLLTIYGTSLLQSSKGIIILKPHKLNTLLITFLSEERVQNYFKKFSIITAYFWYTQYFSIIKMRNDLLCGSYIFIFIHHMLSINPIDANFHMHVENFNKYLLHFMKLFLRMYIVQVYAYSYTIIYLLL